MKKIIIILVLILVTGCTHQEPINKPNDNLTQAEKYCILKGGKIEINIREDREVKTCFVNDGVDGIRCDVDYFFEKKCGHQK